MTTISFIQTGPFNSILLFLMLVFKIMVVLDVYTKNVKIKYKTYLLSKATFIVFSSGLISLVLPFVLSYNTGGFWQKRDVVYEQPEVKFKGEYLFIAISGEDENPIICSSFLFYKTYLNLLDVCSTIKVREIDKNHDGKIDSIHIVIKVLVTKNFKLSSLYLVLPLDYKLNSPCAFQMQSAIIYNNIKINPSTSNLSVFADLQLEQLEPLKCPKTNIMNSYGGNIIEDDHGRKDYELEEIIKNYSNRNIRTYLRNQITTFTPTSDGTFTISLTVKYPEHKIYYIPGFWQVLKFAWIQYFALYVIIAYIMFQIKRYIFDNNLVLLYKERTGKNK